MFIVRQAYRSGLHRESRPQCEEPQQFDPHAKTQGRRPRGASKALLTRSKGPGAAWRRGRFLAEWLSRSSPGMSAFSANRGTLISAWNGLELVFNAIGTMRRRQMNLKAERHFVITDWAIHRIGRS